MASPSKAVAQQPGRRLLTSGTASRLLTAVLLTTLIATSSWWNRSGRPLPLAHWTSPSPAPTAATATAWPGSSAILSPGQSLSSPNGAYTLALERGGDLVLTHNDRPVWWTATGDRWATAGHRVSLTSHHGHHVLRVQARVPEPAAWTTVWHSDLEPGCQPERPDLARAQAEDEPEDEPGLLELSDSGRLRITGTCTLYVPPGDGADDGTDDSTDDSTGDQTGGRSLAVIVAGRYGSNAQACTTHMQALIANHSAFGRVDVFAYVLHDAADDGPGPVEAAVRGCYGRHLRRVEVRSTAGADDDFSDDAAASCGGGARLRRLSNRLKTVDAAGRLWWAWAAEHGVKHDTVLRLRPDTTFASAAEPPFWSVDDLGADTLVMPRARDGPAGGHGSLYCSRMDGRVGIAPTDQVAYGSPAAMGHWLSMYQHFAQMVDLTSSATQSVHRNFSGCEVLPPGPNPEDCARPVSCSLECLMAWYLESRGVSFDVERSWDHRVLSVQ